MLQPDLCSCQWLGSVWEVDRFIIVNALCLFAVSGEPDKWERNQMEDVKKYLEGQEVTRRREKTNEIEI